MLFLHKMHKPHPFSFVPLSRMELYKLSPRVEFCTKKAIRVLHEKIKREFAYQTFIETIAGKHIECELKAVMDFIHYGLFEALKEKDFKTFSGIPLFCFNKQWLIIRILFQAPSLLTS